MWRIIRNAFAHASPGIRRQFRWVAVFWLLVMAAQVWDSRNGRGPAGVAEFMSALLGASGVALLGIAHALQLAMHETAVRPHPTREAAAVQTVLLALPPLAFAAGVMLGGAALLMVLRALLGSELPLAAAGTVVYGGLAVVAGRTVARSAETLFTHATRHAAAAADARSEAAAAQVAALQARMNPHFLFNALNTIASLVRTEPRKAERVVEDLSEVLRRTLDRSSTTSGTVRDEVDYLRAYLALEQERWGERLRVEWNVAANALEHPLPPLMLQPLVENALRHGLASRLDATSVRITIELADVLTLSVEDDGPGFARGWRDGTGLGSVRQRLASLYGDAAILRVVERHPGARVSVVVPRCAAPLISTP